MAHLLFLSHAGIDSDAAFALAERIENTPEAKVRNLKIWIDKRDLQPGTGWQQQLEHVIENESTAFAVYLGDKGVLNWVESEVRIALSRAIKGDYPFIPILNDSSGGSGALPAFARQYHGIRDAGRDDGELSKLIAAATTQDATKNMQLVEYPFIGLRPFGASDNNLFFGRQEESTQLLQDLQKSRLLMVVGDSGSGKSSLVKAGMIPLFRGGEMAAKQVERPDESIWHVIETRPRGNPFETLADDLAITMEQLGHSIEDRNTCKKMIRTQQADAVYDAIKESSPPRARVLLLIDQFEELFTQCESKTRQPFIDTLLYLMQRSDDADVHIVITMRRDYYNLCSQFETFFQNLEDPEKCTKHTTRRMTDAQFHESIVEPLKLGGIEDNLARSFATSVVNDIGDQAGDLTLLQTAMEATWGIHRHQGCDLFQAYAAAGGVTGALAKKAEQAYAGLDEDESDLLVPALLRLVRLGETGGATRRVAAQSEFSAAQWRLVQKLSTESCHRLTVIHGQGGEAQAELPHDALINQWPRFQTMLQNHATFKRSHDWLIYGAGLWISSGRDAGHLLTGARLSEAKQLLEGARVLLNQEEQDLIEVSEQIIQAGARRKRLRIRLTIIGFMLFSILSGTLANWAFQQKENAVQQEVIAVQAREQAESLVNFMLFDLLKQLDPLGRLDILGAVARKAEAYFSSLDLSNARDETKRNQFVALFNLGDVLLALGNSSKAFESYQKGLKIAEQFAQSDPENTGWQLDLSVSYKKLADVLLSIGKRGPAMENYQKSLRIAKQLVQSDPANTGWQLDLSLSYEKIADVLLSIGERDPAMVNYQKSLNIRQQLAQGDPANAGWQRDLSVSYEKIADVLLSIGERDPAMVNYQKSLKIRQQLAQSDPANAGWQRDLSVNYNKLADVLLSIGKRDPAMENYQKSLSIAKQLARSDPANAGWQRDLSVSYEKTADVLLSIGERDPAMESYQKSLKIRQQLAQNDPANAGWQRDLSVSYEKIADVLLSIGERDPAMESFQKSLGIAEQLAQSDPANAGWQRDLSVSYNKLADVLLSIGKRDPAMKNYQKSLGIAEQLAQNDPANAGWQRDLSVAYNKLADVLLSIGERDPAMENYRKSLKIFEKLAQSDPANAGWQTDLVISYFKIGDLLAGGDTEAAGQAKSYFNKALNIVKRLQSQGKLNAAQQGWIAALEEEIAKLKGN